MNISKVFLLAGFAGSFAGLAQAQTVNGEARLSWAAYEFDELQENVHNLQFAGDVEALASMGGVQLSGIFDRLSYEEDDFDAELESTSVVGHAFFRLEEVKLGVFVGRTNVGDASVDGLGTIDLDTDITTYGVEGQFAGEGPLTLAGYAGLGDLEDFDDLEIRIRGASATLAATPEIAVFGSWDFTSLSMEGSEGEFETSSLTIGAEYNLAPAFDIPIAVTGHVGRLTADDGVEEEDATSFGVSVAYLFGTDVTAERSRMLRSYVNPF